MTSSEPRLKAIEALYLTDVRGLDHPYLKGLSGRARRYVQGVWENRKELDQVLSQASRGWQVERMPAVDRAILRLALFELRYMHTPFAVVINEAVNLAKTYSTAESGSFINGVLDALVERDPGHIKPE